MSNAGDQEPVQISSESVMPRGEVGESDVMKIKWALGLSGGALVIGVIFLVVGICRNDTELRTWSTGLISLVVGAALGYAFSGGER